MEAVGTNICVTRPIEEAIDEIEDDDKFWAHQAISPALFLTAESMRTYRLPSKLKNQVHVSDRFHLKPMLQAITFAHNSYVIAIGMRAVRLVEASADMPPDTVKVALQTIRQIMSWPARHMKYWTSFMRPLLKNSLKSSPAAKIRAVQPLISRRLHAQPPKGQTTRSW